MKKYFFAMALCISQLLNAQNAFPEPTRYISQQSNNPSAGLTNFERCFYFRLPNGLVDQFQTDLWDGNQFNLDNTRFNTYDANNKHTATVIRKWDATNGYTDIAREAFTYDANGNRLSEYFERLNTTNNQWEVERTVTYTYSATNKVLERTTFSYYNGQSFGNRSIYTYDSDDREATLTYQNYNNNTWSNQQRNVYFYNDADNKVDVLFLDTWSANTNDWVPANRTSYNYQPTVTASFTEIFNNGTWSNYSSITTNYNANNQVTTYLVSLYTAQGLGPNSGYEIDYNPDNSLHQFRYYYKDFASNVYFQSLQIDYDYGTYSGTRWADLETKIQVYPNPVTNFLRIEATDNTDEMTYTVLDTRGQLVAQGSVNGGAGTLDCHDYPTGAYFLTLHQNGRYKTVPFVKN